MVYAPKMVSRIGDGWRRVGAVRAGGAVPGVVGNIIDRVLAGADRVASDSFFSGTVFHLMVFLAWLEGHFGLNKDQLNFVLGNYAGFRDFKKLQKEQAKRGNRLLSYIEQWHGEGYQIRLLKTQDGYRVDVLAPGTGALVHSPFQITHQDGRLYLKLQSLPMRPLCHRQVRI